MATSTSTANATGTATVTLEKSYFETLLRRAQFHTAGVDYTNPIHLESVTIPKLEHDSLVASARQYENLRRNLYRGGIAEETLAILVRDDTAVEDEPARDETSDAGILLRNQRSMTTTAKEFSSGQDTPRKFFSGPLQDRDGNSSFRGRAHEDEYTYMPEDGFEDDDDTSGHDEVQALKRPSLEKFCQRTVQLCKLPKGVTHADIAEVVRGGMLLDIYLRCQDNTASISFLRAADAENFFRHVKRYDLYIRGKRVEIRWNDRQFILPGHIANKVYIGATRNLLIRNYSPRHTEQMIRDDLEHIHNLVVIKVTFVGQNAHVSTNSVHNAMFARTCMMSRATYKGSKIDWDTDECAAALEKPQSRKENEPPKKKGTSSMMNRFQLLNMDDEEDGSMDDEHNTSGVTFDTMSSRVDALVA